MTKNMKNYQAALKIFQSGNIDESAAVVLAHLKKKPKDANFLRLFGDIAQARGYIQGANDLYRKALQYAPNDSATLERLANNMLNQQKFSDAKQLYLRCAKIAPRKWQPKFNLGMVHRCINEHHTAETYFDEALVLNPLSISAFNFLVLTRLSTGNLSAILNMPETIERVTRFCLQDGQAADVAMLIRLAPLIPMKPETYRLLLHRMDQLHMRPAIQRSRNMNRVDMKIRIGYISGEFGDHPISHVMWDVFKCHNRDLFEIVVYSLVNKNGPIDKIYTEHIKSNSDDYIELSNCNLQRSVERIVHDNIDILVNLSGYMTMRSVEIGSFRPAPLNVYWLGHGGDLGLSSVDYVIANDTVIPETEWPSRGADIYSESVASLPESYHCAPTPFIPECKLCREDFGLNENSIIFCAFNNPSKIDSAVFDVWMNILKRVPGSQLWLSNPQNLDELVQNLRDEAQSRGVDPGRLVFARRIPDKSQHLARHQLADLFLDTFKYNASTTAIDALWSGLPVLTRAGNDFFSRICTSHVINAGLPEMVCDTAEVFEERAVELARNPELLREHREKLLTTRKAQPLFDVPRFVKCLEASYSQMWERYKSGQEPVSFYVKPEEQKR